MTVFLRYGWSGKYNNCEAPSYTQNEYKEPRLLYEQIMAKYDAESYEDHPMKTYIGGSGIPKEQLGKMDSTYADALEKGLIKR